MGAKSQDGGKKLQRSKEHKLSAQPGKTDTTLEVSELFATTAKHIADVAGVPGLGQAADIVLSILNRIQDMRDNKDEFKQLAQEARELVASIGDAFVQALDGATVEGQDSVKKRIQELDKDIQGLIGTLDQINRFALIKAKRNWFWRFIYSRYDIQTIRQYRDAMRHAHEVFGRRTDIVLRVDMAHVHYKADQILEVVKRLDQQNTRSLHTPASSVDSNYELDSRPPKHPHRPPPNPLVQNFSGEGRVIVHNTVDASTHDNSRIHYGDIVTTNTYGNHAGSSYTSPNPARYSPQSYSRGSPTRNYNTDSTAQNTYHIGPTQYSQNYINGSAQFNFDQRNYGYQPQEYGHPPNNQQWVDERYYG